MIAEMGRTVKKNNPWDELKLAIEVSRTEILGQSEDPKLVLRHKKSRFRIQIKMFLILKIYHLYSFIHKTTNFSCNLTCYFVSDMKLFEKVKL